MMTDEQWNALSDDEKDRRITFFISELKRILVGFDAHTIVEALTAVKDNLGP